jgi:maltose O-acetyltransferase
LTILDNGRVVVGDNVMIGPNVQLLTACHPIYADERNTLFEFTKPIIIGDNVWIGGGVTVLPGVSIGKNSVIGAGSVVTKDVPDNVVAAGNPCRIIREITANDKIF